LKTRNRRIGNQEGKAIERKEERRTIKRRAPSEKLDREDGQIPLFYSMGRSGAPTQLISK
jgi:hypothetical protein